MKSESENINGGAHTLKEKAYVQTRKMWTNETRISLYKMTWENTKKGIDQLKEERLEISQNGNIWAGPGSICACQRGKGVN